MAKPPRKTVRTTKTQILINLLERRNGATIENLIAASGWQKHSIHGFISGTLKKKKGFQVSSKKMKNGSHRYRILKDGE